MGAEMTLLMPRDYDPERESWSQAFRRGPFIQTIRGQKDVGREFYAHGSGHQLDFEKLWPTPTTGSTNIRLIRALIYLWRSYHYGTQAELDRGWRMMQGALDQHTHFATEPWAGGAYGQWNGGCWRGIHALAVLVGHPIADQLRAYDLQNMAGYSLVAQAQPAIEATDWRTPFGEPRKPKAAGQWSTTCTHTRAYISPASRNQTPPADIYFNLVSYGDMLRRMVTGQGTAPEFIRETCDALEFVQLGLSKPFAGGPEEQAIRDCMAGRGLGPILGWFKYPLATRFRFVRFEDGAVLSYAESSTNAGSTFFNGAGYQDAGGDRKWTGACIHPSYRSFGKQVLTRHVGRQVISWLPDGVTDPRMIEEFSIEVTDAPIQYDVLLRRDGKAIAQVGGGGVQPPAPPPAPPPDPDMVDVVDLMAPPEMADKVLSRSDGPGYTYHYHDRDAQMIIHINHPQGSPWDVWWYDDDAIYHLLTTDPDHWSEPRHYKRHVPGNNIRIWPRWVPAGATWSPIRMEIPDTGYLFVEDCIEGPRRDLLRGAGIFRPPVPASTLGIDGGAIDPEDLCYQGEWRWQDEQVVETYTLIPAKGRVMWESTNGKGGVPFDVIEDGSAPLVFPCFDLAAEVKRLRQLPPPQPPDPGSGGGGCRSVFILLATVAGFLASAIAWALM